MVIYLTDLERSELAGLGIVIFRNGASGCWNTVTELFSWFLVPELRLVLPGLSPGSRILGGSGVGLDPFLSVFPESIGLDIMMDFLDLLDWTEMFELFSGWRDWLDELIWVSGELEEFRSCSSCSKISRSVGYSALYLEKN